MPRVVLWQACGSNTLKLESPLNKGEGDSDDDTTWVFARIENYRTGLLWDLFMSDPEVQQGLKRLGFSNPHI